MAPGDSIVQSLSSSPDPLTYTDLMSSPTKRSTRGPLVAKSPNPVSKSPAKSMVLHAADEEGKSPWRIKVTVEAQPEINRSVKKSPLKRPRRTTKSAVTPCPAADDLAPVIQKSPRRGAKGSTPAFVQACRPTPGRANNTSSGQQSRLSRLSLLDQTEDHDLDEPSFASDEEDEDRSATRPIPGDATVLESEEFSMISVDSLSSRNQCAGSSPSPNKSTITSGHDRTKPDLSMMSSMPSSPPQMMADRSTPVEEQSSSPVLPPAPVARMLNLPAISSPLRNSAMRSGKVLQDIVRSPMPSQATSGSKPIGHFGKGFGTGTQRQLRTSLHVGQYLSGDNSAWTDIVSSAEKQPSSTRRTAESGGYAAHRLPTPADEKDTTDSNAAVEYPSLTKHLHNASPKDRPTESRRLASPLEDAATHTQRPTSRSQVNNLTTSQTTTAQPQVIDISSDSSDEADEIENEEADDKVTADAHDDKDMWQEEASRCSEEVHAEERPNGFDGHLEEPVRPARSKIPRTWRRKSAHDFHYSDSPEPEQIQPRTTSGSTSSGKSSGVATPPATEDEEEDGSEAAFVKGAAPRTDNLRTSTVQALPRNVEINGPGSDSSTSSVGTDNEDTGFFWHNNLPSLYNRPQRSTARDRRKDMSMMSELQSLSGSSPLKQTPTISQPPKRRSNLRTSTPLKVAHVESDDETALLSSQSHDTNTPSESSRSPPSQNAPSMDMSVSEEYSLSDLIEDTVVNESTSHNISVASDARQLQNEMQAHQRRTLLRQGDVSQTIDSTVDEYEISVLQSYVEELNVASPTKIAVKFNDSTMDNPALVPKKHYPDLFDSAPAQQPAADDASNKTSSKVFPMQQQETEPKKAGLVSKLTTSFWSVVTGSVPATDGSSDVMAKPLLPSTHTVPDAVLRLRRKYGLLSDMQPFTYTHIRTLHRMLASSRIRPESSIIPRSGPFIDRSLQPFLNTTSTSSWDPNQSMLWTADLLHVVDAFMSLLVPDAEKIRLETLYDGQRVAWGDLAAEEYRGWDPRGRHGDWIVFDGTPTGRIKAEWVKGIMGEILFKEERDGSMFNRRSARGDGARRMPRRRRQQTQYEDEVDEDSRDYEQDESLCHSEMLEKVRRVDGGDSILSGR